MSQYIHVSQLYETVLTCAILILLITEILAGYHRLWGHIYNLRAKNRDQQLQWIKVTEGTHDIQKAQAQRYAIQSLRRQMSEYQNKNTVENQNEQKDKDAQQQNSINNLLGELSTIQKSILLFHIQYSNFMSDYVPLIISILVLGILTASTKIFSLACFFCYLFTSLMFDFLHLEERLKEEYKQGIVLRRMVKILSVCFIIAIFIDYWANGEYSG